MKQLPPPVLPLRAATVCLLLAAAALSICAAPPSALVGVFSGASQNSAWCTGSSDPIDAGFEGEPARKSGRTVWKQELERCAPGLAIDTGSKVKAGVGFVGHWWTEADGLTADGAAVRDDLIARLRANPAAAGFVCHVLASAAYNEATPERLRTELAGYAAALRDAVEQEFGAGTRIFTFWWLEPGNRWGNPEGGQSVAAERRRVPWSLAGGAVGGSAQRRPPAPERAAGPGVGEPAVSSPSTLPFFRVAPGTMAYVIGDWNQSGDGIHYPRSSNQRAGRQLAYSMLLDWGLSVGTARHMPSITSAVRDPEDTHALRVRVRINGGKLLASAHPCRVSTADGKGVGVGNQGTLLASEWTCTVDEATASEGYSEVRLRHAKPLPDGTLFFSHTWGTWHTITPGRPGYTGPLAVWHEDLSGATGMAQDFADLTATPRPAILTLGSVHLVPVPPIGTAPVDPGRLPSTSVDSHRRPLKPVAPNTKPK